VLKAVRELEVSNKENYLCTLEPVFLSKQSNQLAGALKLFLVFFQEKN
jgi:hypothetical protein